MPTILLPNIRKRFMRTMPATLMGTTIKAMAESHFLFTKWIPVNAADAMSEKKNTPQTLKSKSKAVPNIMVKPMVRSIEMTTAITA